ncbi:MAG TPA: hypothetical protein VNF74_09850 [Terriglobales bacterium]|nr:hypothetical protein [Terriglobales bacterium]
MATDTLPTTFASEGIEEFLELEAKIHRVAEALKEARAERDQATATLRPLQAAHEKLQQAHAQAEHELVALRKERNEIRQRVARLVKQLEGAEA